MVLMERDKRIIEAVYQYRVLRQDQIEALFFEQSKAAAQRRLFRLYHNGFLERTFLTVRASFLLSPAIYLLDKRGADLLHTELGYEDISWTHKSNIIGQLFLEHTLAINDVRIAVTLACREHGYALLEWRSEADLKTDYARVTLSTKSRKQRTVALVPDSFFVIQAPKGKAPFFLELDRATETTTTFQTKILAYQAYVQSGEYEKRYGYKSLRVLTVVPTGKRLENVKTTTEMVGGEERFWFTTLTAITAHTLFHAPIWAVAGNKERRPLF
jgi:hypothetical protein